MVKNGLKVSKKFITLLSIVFAVLFGVFAFGYLSENYNRFLLSKELNAVELPVDYKLLTKEYDSGDIDAVASLTYTYEVDGTVDEVYSEVVKSLGLNPEDHKNPDYRGVWGVTSPIHKYEYYLTINPIDSSKGAQCLSYKIDELGNKACQEFDYDLRKDKEAKKIQLMITKPPI